MPNYQQREQANDRERIERLVLHYATIHILLLSTSIAALTFYSNLSLSQSSTLLTGWIGTSGKAEVVLITMEISDVMVPLQLTSRIIPFTRNGLITGAFTLQQCIRSQIASSSTKTLMCLPLGYLGKRIYLTTFHELLLADRLISIRLNTATGAKRVAMHSILPILLPWYFT